VAEETAAPEPVAEKPAKQSNKGLIIVIAAVSLISSAGGASLTAYLVGRAIAKLPAAVAHAEASPESEEARKEAELAEAIEHGGVVPLDPFVVNLADQDSARYLRIKVTLMVDDKHKVKEVVENMALTGKVKDVILQTLSRKTSHDLINEEGKNKLRAEIQEHGIDDVSHPSVESPAGSKGVAQSPSALRPRIQRVSGSRMLR